MERSAEADDLVTCPSCRQRDALMIRWLPDINKRVHEQTDVGCARCQIWKSAKEDRWAFWDWNLWASHQWAQLGKPVEHERLYELQTVLGEKQRAVEAADAAVAQYLQKEVVAKSKWSPGDRFVSRSLPRGIWAVDRVEAVYGLNQGPFCILKVVEVRPSGALGERRHEFWDITLRARRLAPFWKPSNWLQVVEGDECLVGADQGRIVSVDRERRRAVVIVRDTEVDIGRLTDLQVPIARIIQSN